MGWKYYTQKSKPSLPPFLFLNPWLPNALKNKISINQFPFKLDRSNEYSFKKKEMINPTNIPKSSVIVLDNFIKLYKDLCTNIPVITKQQKCVVPFNDPKWLNCQSHSFKFHPFQLYIHIHIQTHYTYSY